MKMRIVILLALCISAIGVNAQSADAVKVTAEIQAFVEKGTKPIALESADLNGDGMKDYVLVLQREMSEDETADYPEDQRPLLILVRDKNKKLNQVKRNERMVMCSNCGGVFGDPFAGVEVGKNTFTVRHYGGSAWRWSADYTFNYSRIDKTWQLVKIEKTSYHNVRPMEETLEKTILTPPKDYGKVDIADFNPTDYQENPDEETEKTSDKLITPDSVGKVKIGMTVAEARKALKGFTLERTSDGEGIALIGAREGEREYAMTIYAGEEDPDAKINENAKIEMIEVWYSDYKTAEGVHPRMEISEVEKKYGKLKEIMMSEIESREYATFANQPKDLEFRVLGEGKDAGKYKQGERKTTSYTPGAYLHSILVMGTNDSMDGGTAEFSSVYTDLSSDCKSEGGEEGGHVSTMCKSVGDYKLHYFDSAMSLHFYAEASDRKDSVNLATQALSYETKKNRKIEWRLANGKPFAVIMRVFEHKRTEEGYWGDVIGEKLLVKGLNGFENINFEVDPRRTRKANEEARLLADNAYKQKMSEDFQNLDVSIFNQKIEKAAAANEAWVKMPMFVIAQILSPFEETKSRSIEIVAPYADGSDSLMVIVIDDGFLSDSIRGEKFKFELKKNSNGVWQIVSAAKAQRCYEGRGHQDYSTAPCL